ncbi:MAG: hypothetical protein GDA48_25420 [Hormoscilla sp. GM102CHS1]|nr:hypothetical protein [Hormoscilla sp. GM102CHS1]
MLTADSAAIKEAIGPAWAYSNNKSFLVSYFSESATRFLHKSPFWATGGRCPPYIVSLFPDPEKPPLKSLPVDAP